ncbi:hypothetical protein STCU_11879 [Strigomonas culicis]|uniref:Uncharacterized protein n=1 Tax=Strigomonas culicis TaxID=28005 RepID=S9TFE3_9TRYP|nr:hypothetical protein STCU_11879 [Strigomonas culicis]|eukprot:EPY15629.1 hypothetical protein STCU_11879 [Strigomonas culicis]
MSGKKKVITTQNTVKKKKEMKKAIFSGSIHYITERETRAIPVHLLLPYLLSVYAAFSSLQVHMCSSMNKKK